MPHINESTNNCVGRKQTPRHHRRQSLRPKLLFSGGYRTNLDALKRPSGAQERIGLPPQQIRCFHAFERAQMEHGDGAMSTGKDGKGSSSPGAGLTLWVVSPLAVSSAVGTLLEGARARDQGLAHVRYRATPQRTTLSRQLRPRPTAGCRRSKRDMTT